MQKNPNMDYRTKYWRQAFEKVLLVVFILILVFIPAKSEAGSHVSEKNVDALMHPLVKQGLIGGVVLMAEDGEIVFEKGYGYCDKERQLPNTRDTRFRISSITKIITALAVMQLHEKGHLDIYKPIRKYFKDLPAGTEITIHHLLTHTSGIPSYNWRKSNNKSRPLATVYNWIKKLPLRFKPGTDALYSNSGYALLAIIVEKVSSLSYEEYLKRNIFSPLAMSDTGLTWMNKPTKNLAHGYSKSGYDPYKPATRPTPLGRGDGDLYSTASDLLKLAKAFYSDKIVSAKTRKLMITPYKGRHGLGWYIGQREGYPIIYHPGGSLGYISNLRIYKQGKKILISLFNSDFLLFRQVERQLEVILFGESSSPLFSNEKNEKYLGRLKPFLGQYRIDKDETFKIFLKNGNLTFQETGFPECAAYIYEENKVYITKNNYDITFIEDNSGLRFEGLFGLYQVKGPKIFL